MHKQQSPPPADSETADLALEQTLRPSRDSVPVSEVVLSLIQLQQNTKCEGDLDLFLRRLVEGTRLLVGATGAALALRDKQIARWRARCGENGPSIGAPLYTGCGISGECLASGRPQSCEDTQNDPRLDAEVSRQLGVRSMVVAPVKGATDDVEGILEAWSPEPRAFDKWCLEILQELARLVTAARSRPAIRSMSTSEQSPLLPRRRPAAIAWALDRIRNLASKVRDWSRRVMVFLFPLL
ncbi:MAG TPA: GAF domain-containing protein, partial [Acidobacteriota bacterium]|nr:GAF domain-containing protein [Acidobacteriota bacterium]